MVKAPDRPDSIFDHRLWCRTRWRGALLGTIIAIGLACCVPIPRDHVEGREVDPNAVTLIKIGFTTRQEVLAQLGEPTTILEDEHVLAYSWDRVNWTVYWVLVGPTPSTATYYWWDIRSHEMLLVQIDEADRVKRAERVERPESVSYSQFLSDCASGKINNKP